MTASDPKRTFEGQSAFGGVLSRLLAARPASPGFGPNASR